MLFNNHVHWGEGEEASYTSCRCCCLVAALLARSLAFSVAASAVSSSLFGVSRAVQEFGLARFKSNVTKTMKGFEYILAKLQGEAPSKTLVETAKEAKEKAKETALAATEKAKDLANKAATKQQQRQLV